MSALDEARADLEAKCAAFNRCAASTTPPGILQKAVRDLMCAVDSWADTKRETVRES